MALRYHSDNTGDRSRPLKVTYRFADGTSKKVTAYHGQNLLDVAIDNELPVEGACAGSCACSTCHVYLKDSSDMDLFPEPTDEENDMLDLAFFCQPTSRLGCQLVMDQTKHDGLEVELPRATRNMAPDGYTVYVWVKGQMDRDAAQVLPLPLAEVMFTPYATKKPRGIAPVGMVIDKSCRVYITNIPLERIEREGSNALFKEFEALGPIDSYKMFTDKSGRFLGSALCTYRNPADAAACVTKMNNAIVGATTVTLATAGEGNEEGSLASDGSPNALPLKVTQARDHGVVLLHQSLDRGFDPSSTQNVNITPRNAPYSKPTAQADSADEAGGMKPSSTAGSRANPNDRWTHDKYERLFQHAHVDGLDDSEMPRGGGVEDWAEDDDVYSGGVSRNVRHPRRSLATRGRGRHARDGGPRRFREERGHGDSTLSSYSSGRRKERPLRGAEIDAAFESYVTQRDEMLGLGAIQARAIPVAALPLTEDERPAVPVPPSGVSPPEPQVGDAPSS